MWKLSEPLLEWLKKHPLGREFLLVLALPAAAIGVAELLIKDPIAWRLVTHYGTVALCLAVFGLWLASLLWRASLPRSPAEATDLPPILISGELRDASSVEALRVAAERRKRTRLWLLRTSAGLCAASALTMSAKLLWLSFPPKIPLRIYFDHATYGRGQVLVRLLESGGLFTVEAIESPLDVKSNAQTIAVTDALVAAAITNLKYAKWMLPIVVTRRVTEGGRVAPIIAQPSRAGAVISTYFAGPGGLDDLRIQRYVATSIALEAINSQYMISNGVNSIPNPRIVDVNTGCLSDFYRYPADFVVQAQAPKLCERERSNLRQAFGEPTVQSLEATLEAIGALGRLGGSTPTGQ